MVCASAEQPGGVCIVTLGCSKNLVDSERLGSCLRYAGWQVRYDCEPAADDVLVLNTCGFIGDAQEESVNYILRAVELQQHGQLRDLLVMGCLSQRFGQELRAEIPEVAHWYGARDLGAVLAYFDLPQELLRRVPRHASAHSHYAYLKIAEGCNRHCHFCAIPGIRGGYRSVAPERLLEEARGLVADGAKELILVAQELTSYGQDLPHRPTLLQLLEGLEAIEGLGWIRMHYAYPTGYPLEVLEWMRSSKKACRYFDLPLQHISDRVLRSMNRTHTSQSTYALIEKVRTLLPEASLRTSLIVGYPTEGEAEFRQLEEFVRQVEFDQVGVFTYSSEAGTYAGDHLEDCVPEAEKHARRDAIMELQQEISARRLARFVGQTMPVLIDDRVGAHEWVGRMEFASPEVDGEVQVRSPEQPLTVGQFARVRITASDTYDLEARVEFSECKEQRTELR